MTEKNLEVATPTLTAQETAKLSNEDLAINLKASIVSKRPELISLYAQEAAKRLLATPTPDRQ